MTSLNLANNSIGQLVPPDGWRAEGDDGAAPWIHTDGQRVEDGMPEGSTPVGVIALANAIPDMRASSKLDASANIMFQYEDKTGITAWAEALKANTSITELNLAKNDIDASDAKILAPAISDNEALTSLDISNQVDRFGDGGIGTEGAKYLVEALKDHA